MKNKIKEDIKRDIRQNKNRICQNIKTIRFYLEFTPTQLANALGNKRFLEFENGRFLPSEAEIKALADLAELNYKHIIYHRFQTQLIAC